MTPPSFQPDFRGRFPYAGLIGKLAALNLLSILIAGASAVEIVSYPGGSTNYNTSNNISETVTSWSTGWGTANPLTGWNYIGQIIAGRGYGSGVYLGNGWVLTAGHVGVGNFTLNGNTFNPTGTSYSDFTLNISGVNQIADLTLFQILTTSSTGSSTLSMPPLTLTPSTNAPTAFSRFSAGSQVVMIGYGGGQGEAWGVNTVTATSQATPVTSGSQSFDSADFVTAYGVTSYGSGFFGRSITNTAQVYPGDSGGGDFINVNGTWELAGINEAVGSSSSNLGFSYMVQLSYYDSQIQSIMSLAPEPGDFLLSAFGLLVAGFAIKRRTLTRKV